MPKGVPNKRYTPEFRQIVVETMMQQKLSYCEAARQFDVSNHHRVADRERIYLMEGPERLYIECRGRRSKGHPAKFPKEVEEDLLREVQRLRAENTYLKNYKPWFWKKIDARAKSKVDPETEARTQSDNIAGNRSTAAYTAPPNHLGRQN